MKTWNWKLFWIIFSALAIIITFWTLNYYGVNTKDGKPMGEFGDKFGVVNALFSGLAFAGIIITIYMQREELALQRKELEETREVFEKQSNIMADQQNDSTYFNLLSNHRLTVQSIKTSGSVPEYWENNYYARSNEMTTGYEVVESVAAAWIHLFTEYSKMYRSGIIWNISYANEKPVDVVLKNENIVTMVQEVTHIWKFIDKRFHPDLRPFYEETLVRSLLDAEKFIVHSWFTAQNLAAVSPFGRDQYERHTFIDITKELLPGVNLEFQMNNYIRPFSVDSKLLKFQTEAKIINYYTVINPSIHLDGSLEVQKVELEIQNNKIELTVLDFFRNTSLGFNQFPLTGESTNDLSLFDFFVLFEIKYRENWYFIPVKLSFDRREERHGSNEYYILSNNRNLEGRWLPVDITLISGIIDELKGSQKPD